MQIRQWTLPTIKYLRTHRGTVSRPFVLVKDMDKERQTYMGQHYGRYEKNKKRIFATQTVCGICGKPVDFSLKYPHPLSPTIDHIIPLAKGGHPSDIDNLQLAHRCCNRQKSDKLVERKDLSGQQSVISNRVLPATFDWTKKPLKAIERVS